MCTAVYTADPMVTKADASLPPPQRQGQLDLFIRFCMTHLLVLPTNTHTQHAASLPCSLLDGTRIPNARNNLGGEHLPAVVKYKNIWKPQSYSLDMAAVLQQLVCFSGYCEKS